MAIPQIFGLLTIIGMCGYLYNIIKEQYEPLLYFFYIKVAVIIGQFAFVIVILIFDIKPDRNSKIELDHIAHNEVGNVKNLSSEEYQEYIVYTLLIAYSIL